MRLVLTLGLIVFVCGIASAYQTTDSVVLTVTPVLNVSVNISSTTNTFGTSVPLGSSRTLCVGIIQNDGNVSTYWHKRAQSSAIDNSNNTWSLVTDADDPGEDEFKLLAITTGVATPPNFTAAWAGPNTNTLIDGRHLAADKLLCTAANTTLSEGVGVADSPKHVTLESRRLWVSIIMPNTITAADQAYSMTLSIGANTSSVDGN